MHACCNFSLPLSKLLHNRIMFLKKQQVTCQSGSWNNAIMAVWNLTSSQHKSCLVTMDIDTSSVTMEEVQYLLIRFLNFAIGLLLHDNLRPNHLFVAYAFNNLTLLSAYLAKAWWVAALSTCIGTLYLTMNIKFPYHYKP